MGNPVELSPGELRAANTRLFEYAERAECEKVAENKKKFKTYSAAILEITRLQYQVKGLEIRLELKSIKRSKGRPKKRRSGLAAALAGTLKKTPRKHGRPLEHKNAFMRERLKGWDSTRQTLSEKNNKALTDKAMIEILSKNWTDLSQRDVRELKKQLLSRIKYFRDETGIRIRKRKNPLKK